MSTVGAKKSKAASRRAPRARTVLTGGTVVSMNARREVGLADVLIEGDRIGGVGRVNPRASDEVIDVSGHLVIPGLVQAHVHLAQTLFRGQGDDLDLLDWLRQRIWPLEARHTKASLLSSALLGGAELLASGTTAILDMGTVHHTDAIFEAAKKLGLRATIGKAMMDAGQAVPVGLRETTDASIEESVALAERWHGAEDGRLRYAFAPRFVLSCSEDLFVRTAKEARARGLRLHTHTSENVDELDVVRERTGRDAVAFLHDVGFTGADAVLVHCVWLTSGEQRLLADTKTNVVHCPAANLKLGSGLAKIPDLLAMGVNVALGTDGAACSNRLDLFDEMRLASLVHKPRYGARAMPAKTVFELATLGGAKALGLEGEIGSIEEGKKADLAVVNPASIHAAPAHDPYSMLVYALTGRDVEHVFVDGILRVKKGKVLGVDVKKLVAEANALAAELTREL